MIRRPITLILGAGASVPYGYPTGAELTTQIIELLDWAVPTKNALSGTLQLALEEQHRNEFGDLYINLANFCLAVKKYRPTNIDSFLRDSPSLQDLGRRLLGFLIRKSEYNDRGDIVAHYAKSAPWYQLLFEALVSGNEPNEVSKSQSLRIITFNYDVSLEYFLATALVGYERTQKFAEEIYNSIPIVHMFGKVGEVTIKNGRVNYDYGYCRNIQGNSQTIDQRAWNMSENCNLHVAIETKHKHDEVLKSSELAKKYLYEANHILCLGFDFALDNCALLDLPKEYWDNHPLFYLNYHKSANLDRRVSAFRKDSSNTNARPLNADSCYDALIREYDLA